MLTEKYIPTLKLFCQQNRSLKKTNCLNKVTPPSNNNVNGINHFLFSFSLNILLFQEYLSLRMIILMTIIFSVFIDVDQIITYMKNGQDNGHLRTWLQEPLGFFLIFVPLAWILSFVNPYFFPLVLLTVSSHILLDYITIHKVKPLSPVRRRERMIGFVKPYPEKKWMNKQRGISEMYFLAANTLFFVLVIT
jgi:membrane-bound metal-dependent hydrolase YbcI (DUF457 family)